MPDPRLADIATIGVVVAILAGAVALTLAIGPVTAESGTAVAAVEELVDPVAEAARLPACRTQYTISDDLYNDAPMHGLYCVGENSGVLVVRSYPASRDVELALQDWPLAAADHYLVRGETWFAVGAFHDVEPLSRRNDAEGPTQNPAPPPSPAMTPQEEARAECVRFLTTAVRDRASDPSQFTSERDDFETIYPGMPQLIEDEITADELSVLRASAGNDLQFESVASRIVSPLKEFCRADSTQ